MVQWWVVWLIAACVCLAAGSAFLAVLCIGVCLWRTQVDPW